ncbi:DUF3800 domain-containing protein [Bacillus cereus group sp. MYBK34-1]|uniref:DUF3800 domain-containing protein n=1 Tax=Bacillus cereus group sp. MYBK34-1 TaxID=3450631 RepID=UPI003F7AEC29
MYIFLDDSGNIDDNKPFYVWAGFSLNKPPKYLQSRLDKIFESLPNGKSKSGELKGFEATFEQRKKIFQCIADWDDLRICYIVTDKQTITKNQATFNSDTRSLLKAQSETYFLAKVVSRLAEPYPQREKKKMQVFIDGHAPERLINVHDKKKKENIDVITARLHEYLTLRINYPKWNNQYYWSDFEVKYIPHPNHSLMQAIDFVANFINKYYTTLYNNVQKQPHEQEVANLVALYNILRPKIYHKIYGLSDVSTL